MRQHGKSALGAEILEAKFDQAAATPELMYARMEDVLEQIRLQAGDDLLGFVVLHVQRARGGETGPSPGEFVGTSATLEGRHWPRILDALRTAARLSNDQSESRAQRRRAKRGKE